MKKGVLICIVILILLIAIWAYPVKRTISFCQFNINDYALNGKTVLLCNSENSTDVQFCIKDSAGIERCPTYIKKLTGNTPEKKLKYPIDDFYETSFLLIGNFDEDITDLKESYVFHVDEWYTVGAIKRLMFVMWYPSYGFNVFELR